MRFTPMQAVSRPSPRAGSPCHAEQAGSLRYKNRRGFNPPAKTKLNMNDNPYPTDAASRDSSWRRFVLPVCSMAGVVALSNVLVQFHINDWLTYAAFSYPLTYFVTDVCNRWAGVKLARGVAWAGFVTGVTFSLVFHVPWRIALASGSAFIVSQLLDIAVFNKLRKKSWWKAPFWGSSAASVIDTLIFFSIAFAGVSDADWLKLATGDLCVKLTMAVVLLAPFRVFIVWMGLAPAQKRRP